MDQLGERKARGAFFTPAPIARFISSWAIQTPSDTVLEPSCGEAAFLLAAASRLSLLGSRLNEAHQLNGVELHDRSASAARKLLGNLGAKASITLGDFFLIEPDQQFDAVIGNPPFIRYQEFSGQVRAKSLEAALSQGVRLSGLASSWAAFTVHATRFLKSEGRLGLVLPAELLTVGYAAEVRRFLLKRFGRVRLVLFEQRVFPDVLEDTILLLAEGTGGASHFEVYQAKTAADLEQLTIHGWTDHEPDASDKWTRALIDASSYDAFVSATGTANIGCLSEWGGAYLGAVTGNNSFFCLSAKDVAAHKLAPEDVAFISPPGARHLKGLTFTKAAWQSLVEDDKRAYLFCPRGHPSAAGMRYIEAGEAASVDEAYKCKVRSPWWRVPLTRRPDFLITYMNNDRLRFVRNEADVDILNSVYGFRLSELIQPQAQRHLPIALLNSVTMLSAELSGRVHGGGMLKHEPRQLGKLVTPSVACVLNASVKLEGLAPQIGRLLRKNGLREALRLVDEVILIETAGLNRKAVECIAAARERLLARRLALGESIA